MDIKDSYLHGTVGVVKSISVSADKLKYTLADIAGTVREVTLPVATTSANGLMSSGDKLKLDNLSTTLGNYVTLNTDQEITGTKTFTKQLKFTVAKGTAPFLVTSDTKVTNLNADLLDGYHSDSFIKVEQVSEELNTDPYTWIKEYALTNGNLKSRVYNTNGKEWAYIINIKDNKNHGNILRTSYGNGNTPEMLLMGLYSGAWSGWRTVAFTDSNITGNAATATHASTADKLKTKRKLWGLDFDGSADVSGIIYGCTTIRDANNNWIVGKEDDDNGEVSLGSAAKTQPVAMRNGQGYIYLDSYGNVGIGKTNPVQKLEVNGNVKANSFIGNLDGTYVNKLTNYTKATAISAIATTDSLNTALGKLEYKADTTYDLVKGAYDGDGTIENLAEILKVLEGISDTETIKAIIGKYLPLTGGTLDGSLYIGKGGNTGYKYLQLTRNDHGLRLNNLSTGAYLSFGTTNNSNDFTAEKTLLLGDNGLLYSPDQSVYHDILHTGNYTNFTVTKTGGGANGTWGINISGNAATATNASKLNDYKVSPIGKETGLPLLRRFGAAGNYATYIKVGLLTTPAVTDSDKSFVMFTVYGTNNFGNNNYGMWDVVVSTRYLISITTYKRFGSDSLKVGYVTTSEGVEIWLKLASTYVTDTNIEFKNSTLFTESILRQSTEPSGIVYGSVSESLTTSNYDSYLGYIGTTAVQSSSSDQALTGITNATMSGVTTTDTLVINNTSGVSHITFKRSSWNYITAPVGGIITISPGLDVSSVTGYLFTSTTFQPAATQTYDMGTNALLWRSIHAVNFIGNLQGNADSASKLNMTSLSTYDDLSIEGFKGYNNENGSTSTNGFPHANSSTAIAWGKGNCKVVIAARAGQTNSEIYVKQYHQSWGDWYRLLHSGNTYINSGTITINGTSITPLTQHQSLSNYVTLNTDQEIIGVKTFTKQLKFTVAEGTAPFTVLSTTKVTNLNADLLDGYNYTRFHRNHRTDISDLTKAITSDTVTFDYSKPTGAPTEMSTWVNGFVSSHSNYLSSFIINEHRTNNWWVGYIDTDNSTSVSWKKLAFTTDIPTSLKNPHAIKFKDVFNTEISYDGSAVIDMTYGVNCATKLYNTLFSENQDLNTLISEKVYTHTGTSVCASLVNGPTNRTNGEIRLETITCGSNNYGFQILYTRGGSDYQIWHRTWNGSTPSFTNWVQDIHSGNYTNFKHAYTNLTGSGTTINLAIVSNGTVNGWVLKTLGARAFDDTAYLPLAGGTMSNKNKVTNLNADLLDGYEAVNLFPAYIFPNQHGVYICLGTLTIPLLGYGMRLHVFTGYGYNAGESQGRFATIYIRTSNGTANSSGYYYAGHVETNKHGCYKFYIVQNSSTSFTLWVDKTNYTGAGCFIIPEFKNNNVKYEELNTTHSELPSTAVQLPAYQIAYTDSNVASASRLKNTTIVSKLLSLSNASWTDTGYTFESLDSGTYAVQVTCGNLVASGIMSVYKNITDTAGDEIPLHVYHDSTQPWRPYLRTSANKLLISSNDGSATSRTVTIKIALIL